MQQSQFEQSDVQDIAGQISMNKLIILALLLGTLFVSGCLENNTATTTDPKKQISFTDYQVTRYHDDELNVTCWITDTTSRFGANIAWGGGISCLSDSQLNLTH